MTLGRDVDVLVVDFHGEATSEKMAMGHYLDGHVSLVVGTHTHIPTADCRVLMEEPPIRQMQVCVEITIL